MSHPDSTGYRRTYYRTAVAHRIALLNGFITRDGLNVKVARVDGDTIRIGCTTVEIAALKRLLELVDKSDVLQEGAE